MYQVTDLDNLIERIIQDTAANIIQKNIKIFFKKYLITKYINNLVRYESASIIQRCWHKYKLIKLKAISTRLSHNPLINNISNRILDIVF